MTNKIVIIRGNSGSGKTTVAKELCQRLGKDCMLLSQDVIRREVLHTNDGYDSVAIELLSKLVLFGKEHSKIVIIEGILNSTWYKPLFDTIKNSFSNIYSYYYDIPFNETVKRFQTKNNADFTEEDMKRWWKEKDILGFNNEKMITKEMSVDDVVEMILTDIREEL